LPSDALGAGKVRYLEGVASGADSLAMVTRTALQIPAASADQVSIVMDERICKKVAAAYFAALGKAVTGRSLYVIRVGSGYVAVDPTELVGVWSVAMTLDRHFTVLAKFTG
jgi:hypothetical protein